MPQQLHETEPPLTPQRKLLPSAGGGWQGPAAPPPSPRVQQPSRRATGKLSPAPSPAVQAPAAGTGRLW